MSNDDLRVPEVYWQERLPREELNYLDRQFIEERLELRLFGYLKPEEYIVGCRVLYEDNGYADLLLMRRDFTQKGYWFDLDVTLGHITENESGDLRRQVRQTIEGLMPKPMPG
jgi:hypothetical protein